MDSFGAKFLKLAVEDNHEGLIQLGRASFAEMKQLPEKNQKDIAELFFRTIGSTPAFEEGAKDDWVNWINKNSRKNLKAEAEKFLAAKSLQEIDGSIEQTAAELMSKIEQGYPDLAVKVFHRAVELAKQDIQSNPQSKLNYIFSDSLLTKYIRDGEASMNKASVVLDISRSSRYPYIVEGFGHYQFTEFFNDQIKGKIGNEFDQSLTQLITDLNAMVDQNPKAEFVLCISLWRFVGDFEYRDENKALADWIIKNRQTKPIQNLVRHMDMAYRLHTDDQIKSGDHRRRKFSDLGSLDDAQAFFSDIILNHEEYPQGLRLATWKYVIHNFSIEWKPELVLFITQKAIESLHNDEHHCRGRMLEPILREFGKAWQNYYQLHGTSEPVTIRIQEGRGIRLVIFIGHQRLN